MEIKVNHDWDDSLSMESSLHKQLLKRNKQGSKKQHKLTKTSEAAMTEKLTDLITLTFLGHIQQTLYGGQEEVASATAKGLHLQC